MRFASDFAGNSDDLRRSRDAMCQVALCSAHNSARIRTAVPSLKMSVAYLLAFTGAN